MGDTRPRPIEASEPRMRSVIGRPVIYAIDCMVLGHGTTDATRSARIAE